MENMDMYVKRIYKWDHWIMGIETKAIDRKNGYLLLFLLVCQKKNSTLVCTKLMVADLLEMLDLQETLPKYSLGWARGELKSIITMLVLRFASSKIGFGA